MSLQFIGIDPETGDKASPTVWVDREKQQIVFQGWKPDADLEAQCAAFEVPGHAKGIPEGEAVVTIPARMLNMVREACDALDAADVR
ncbi:hypothetical protein [Streptomyces montanisoli]|uniref:Uncharacterized protein n=1 Tax=Streptomyces montanisoli TaxID=2798581 RepID=A0A940MG96_9ACTN|nr:hypothetical protein [Streptomyces montanisoli]MBP0459761.1 hypothetical protein [Streptomyces montanisoli]